MSSLRPDENTEEKARLAPSRGWSGGGEVNAGYVGVQNLMRPRINGIISCSGREYAFMATIPPPGHDNLRPTTDADAALASIKTSLGCLVLAIIAANWIAVYVAWKLIQ